jgi:hypothetical protein
MWQRMCTINFGDFKREINVSCIVGLGIYFVLVRSALRRFAVTYCCEQGWAMRRDVQPFFHTRVLRLSHEQFFDEGLEPPMTIGCVCEQYISSMIIARVI